MRNDKILLRDQKLFLFERQAGLLRSTTTSCERTRCNQSFVHGKSAASIVNHTAFALAIIAITNSTWKELPL